MQALPFLSLYRKGKNRLKVKKGGGTHYGEAVKNTDYQR
jgi:PHP family Zn ribbon phosphoesterase